MPRAVVAGASGFIGAAMCEALVADGYDVVRIGRREAVSWHDPARIAEVVEGADVVVNFAGKSVNCRYTDPNRDEILSSRVQTTAALRTAIAAAARPPRVWINSSTATIYAHAMDRPHTEDGSIGEGFSVDVARNWEQEFFAGDLPGTRRVALRMAIVLGDGPATKLLLTLARLGLGGPQHDGPWFPHRRYRGIGSDPSGPDVGPPVHRTRGRQKFSWIHLDDVIRAIRFLIDRDDLEGPVNLSSPHPSDNAELMRTLRRTVGMPVGLPSWRWMLEPAMWLLRTEPELILKSRWVLPGVLTDAGFEFSHPDLGEAVNGIVARDDQAPRTAS
ncbi:DUF1731 domain-containing protein [Microbacterium sp. ET2]|uniref:epimerase n=1 Tax=Microbacterium albipurpureum TaxID=3050384 RepID=UPI00259C7F10|nr:DUF1731 domain-containing protein [Microbacterium sp. ET2 (Ac-2212)]WJL95693.1 DUF1731 domain-containing protein [Microbacterium sp. ET2 (Ac-2212)]